MTGDIFKFDDNEYGLLITPECDITDTEKEFYEFLIIMKDKSKEYQDEKKKKFIKDQKSVKSIFNNGIISRHILPSFPFDIQQYDAVALINFISAFVSKNKNEIKEYRTEFKLNSPYIHQLRQRYIAFLGRYGVPAIPDSLRTYNLK
jgi:hypothetical protein